MPAITQKRHASSRHPKLIDRLGEQLRADAARLRLAHEMGADGAETARAHSEAVAEVLRQAYELCFQRAVQFHGIEFTLVAAGRLGRRLLEPGADAELILVQREDPHELSHDTLRALDDFEQLLRVLRLSSIPTRILSVSELQGPLPEDFMATTALLDVSFVAGDRGLFGTEMVGALRPRAGIAGDHLAVLIETSVQRNRQFGFVGTVRAPQIELCSGGMRDFDSLHWFSRFLGLHGYRDLVSEGILSEAEAAVVGKAADFLMRVRAALHFRHSFAACPRDVLTPEDRRVMAPLFEIGGAHDAALDRGESFSAGLHRHGAGLMRAALAAFSRFFARHNLARADADDAGEPIDDDGVPF